MAGDLPKKRPQQTGDVASELQKIKEQLKDHTETERKLLKKLQGLFRALNKRNDLDEEVKTDLMARVKGLFREISNKRSDNKELTEQEIGQILLKHLDVNKQKKQDQPQPEQKTKEPEKPGRPKGSELEKPKVTVEPLEQVDGDDQGNKIASRFNQLLDQLCQKCSGGKVEALKQAIQKYSASKKRTRDTIDKHYGDDDMSKWDKELNRTDNSVMQLIADVVEGKRTIESVQKLIEKGITRWNDGKPNSGTDHKKQARTKSI